ncbi:MAG: hypothetical protein RL235_11 [Chlamydiota bacterium]
MDESVPYTKKELERLFLGVELTEEEYSHYFDQFLKAQHALDGLSEGERIKRSMDWNGLRGWFLVMDHSRDIYGVPQYRDRLRQQQSAQVLHG